MKDTITMSRKEHEQSSVFSRLANKEISQKEAAFRLKLSPRWVRIKLKRYLKNGVDGLFHKSRGRSSSKRWDPQEKGFMLNLLRSEWQGFGPTFTSEKLLELHGIKVSKETVRTVMIKEGLRPSNKEKKEHRERRERRPIKGHMIQLDGSIHDWFEGRGPRCTLIVFIDDATSQILWLEFVKSESTQALMLSCKNYFEAFGRPHTLYVDRGSVFNVNRNNQEKDKKTQWGRAMDELNIEVIYALSAPAKGRVERANKTLQDRLIKEMRLANISSMEAANAFVQAYFIPHHNQKFAVQAALEGDAHRPVEAYNLHNILAVNDTRILANDYTITHNRTIYQIHASDSARIKPRSVILIRHYCDGTTKLFLREIELKWSIFVPRKQPVKPEEKTPEWIRNKMDEYQRRSEFVPQTTAQFSPRRVG